MTEELVAMPVKREPVEAPAAVETPIAPPLEPLHAVGEPRHTPARLPTLEVVRELLQPPLHRPHNPRERGQAAWTPARAPGSERALGPRLRVVVVAQVRQGGPHGVGGLALRRRGDDPRAQGPLRRRELRRSLAKRPHGPLPLGLRGLGPRALEPLACRRAPGGGAVAVSPRPRPPRADELGPWDLRGARAHDAFLPRRACALARAPPGCGARAPEGGPRLLRAGCPPRQARAASPRARRRPQRDASAGPAREGDLVAAAPPQPFPSGPVPLARHPAVEAAVARVLREAACAGGLRERRGAPPAPGPWRVRRRGGATRLVPRAPWWRRRAARPGGAASPCGPKRDDDGHGEPGQLATAHDRIPPVRVAKRSTAAAAPGPCAGALDAEAPVPVCGPLWGEDPNRGPVPRPLEDVGHRDSHREPGPPSAHKGALSLDDTWSPSRQFRESQNQEGDWHAEPDTMGKSLFVRLGMTACTACLNKR